MIAPVMRISIYSAETNGAHAHNRDRVPLSNRDDNRVCLGLSAGTVITKESKEPTNRVLMGAFLFGCIVSFVIRTVICASGTVYLDPLYILTPLHNINRQNVMANKFILGRLGENQPYKVLM